MGQNNAKNKIIEISKTAGRYILRWLYFAALISVSVYAFWIWNKYIIKASWSEEKKQSYIQEQSVFSFDKENYEKAVNLLKIKEERLQSGEEYDGRDLFFPEGF